MITNSTKKSAQPLDFGSGTIAKNRLFFASMGLDLCDGEGFPKDSFFDFYGSLIDGGCGFGYLCNASVDVTSRYNSRGLKLTSQRHADALEPIFEIAKSKQFKLGVQLQHYGPQGAPSREDGSLLSPSGILTESIANRFPNSRMVMMTKAQIAECIDQFSYSAQLALQAGAGLIQLQASNGYLLSSFLSPRTNHREDEWGGNPLKRAKILLSIIDRIHETTKGRLPISIRLGIDDGFGDSGQHSGLLGDVVIALQNAGVVSIECSLGVSETFRLFFENKDLTLRTTRQGSRYFKSLVDIPIGFAGSVFSVAEADEIIQSGDADFIGFARAVLADNHLVLKENNGRQDQVNRCRGDAFCFRDKKEPKASRVYCCVNPHYLRPNYLQQLYEKS